MNYIKTAGQFVCKMAMPLALVFAACSDNGNWRMCSRWMIDFLIII